MKHSRGTATRGKRNHWGMRKLRWPAAVTTEPSNVARGIPSREEPNPGVADDDIWTIFEDAGNVICAGEREASQKAVSGQATSRRRPVNLDCVRAAANYRSGSHGRQTRPLRRRSE